MTNLECLDMLAGDLFGRPAYQQLRRALEALEAVEAVEAVEDGFARVPKDAVELARWLAARELRYDDDRYAAERASRLLEMLDPHAARIAAAAAVKGQR